MLGEPLTKDDRDNAKLLYDLARNRLVLVGGVTEQDPPSIWLTAYLVLPDGKLIRFQYANPPTKETEHTIIRISIACLGLGTEGLDWTAECIRTELTTFSEIPDTIDPVMISGSTQQDKAAYHYSLMRAHFSAQVDWKRQEKWKQEAIQLFLSSPSPFGELDDG